MKEIIKGIKYLYLKWYFNRLVRKCFNVTIIDLLKEKFKHARR